MSTAPEWPFSVPELEALTHAAGGARASADQSKVERLSRRIGSNAAARARLRAREIVDEAAADGSLAAVAEQLDRRRILSGAEVAEVIQPRGGQHDA